MADLGAVAPAVEGAPAVEAAPAVDPLDTFLALVDGTRQEAFLTAVKQILVDNDVTWCGFFLIVGHVVRLCDFAMPVLRILRASSQRQSFTRGAPQEARRLSLKMRLRSIGDSV